MFDPSRRNRAMFGPMRIERAPAITQNQNPFGGGSMTIQSLLAALGRQTGAPAEFEPEQTRVTSGPQDVRGAWPAFQIVSSPKSGFRHIR